MKTTSISLTSVGVLASSLMSRMPRVQLAPSRSVDSVAVGEPWMIVHAFLLTKNQLSALPLFLEKMETTYPLIVLAKAAGSPNASAHANAIDILSNNCRCNAKKDEARNRRSRSAELCTDAVVSTAGGTATLTSDFGVSAAVVEGGGTVEGGGRVGGAMTVLGGGEGRGEGRVELDPPGGIAEPSLPAGEIPRPPCSDGGKRLGGRREVVPGGRREVKGPLGTLAARKSRIKGMGFGVEVEGGGWVGAGVLEEREAMVWEMAREEEGVWTEADWARVAMEDGVGAEVEEEATGAGVGAEMDVPEVEGAGTVATGATATAGDGRRGSLVGSTAGACGFDMKTLAGGRGHGCGKEGGGAEADP